MTYSPSSSALLIGELSRVSTLVSIGELSVDKSPIPPNRQIKIPIIGIFRQTLKIPFKNNLIINSYNLRGFDK